MNELGNLVNIGNKQGWCRNITKMRDMHMRTICSIHGRERIRSVRRYNIMRRSHMIAKSRSHVGEVPDIIEREVLDALEDGR